MGLLSKLLLPLFLTLLWWQLQSGAMNRVQVVRPWNVSSYAPELPPQATLILIPGLDGITSFFERIVPHLTAKHNHVIVWSIPLKSEVRGDYSIEILADMFLSEMATVLSLKHETIYSGPPLVIVAESFGSVIAQAVIARNCSRMPLQGAVMLSPVFRPPPLTWSLHLKRTLGLPLLQAVYDYTWQPLAQILFALGHVGDVVASTDPSWLSTHFLHHAAAADFASVHGRITALFHYLTEIEAAREREKKEHEHKHKRNNQDSPSVTVPLLCLYGGQDQLTPPSDSHPPCSLIMYSDCGHLLHVIEPNAVAADIQHFVHSQLHLQLHSPGHRITSPSATVPTDEVSSIPP